jgi:hypothetical protein
LKHSYLFHVQLLIKRDVKTLVPIANVLILEILKL